MKRFWKILIWIGISIIVIIGLLFWFLFTHKGFINL
jgi:hypothetical protein